MFRLTSVKGGLGRKTSGTAETHSSMFVNISVEDVNFSVEGGVLQWSLGGISGGGSQKLSKLP